MKGCDLGLMLSSIPVVLRIRDLVSPKLSNAQCLQGCSAQAVLDEVSPDFSRFCTCCCTSWVHAVCLHAEYVCTHSLVATVCEGQDVSVHHHHVVSRLRHSLAMARSARCCFLIAMRSKIASGASKKTQLPNVY